MRLLEKLLKMKYTLFIMLIIGVLISCNQKPAKNQPESLESKLKKEAVVIAKDYASKQLKTPVTTVDGFGIITIKDDIKRYRIDPSKILIGQIDFNESKDVLVTITSTYQQDIGMPEHLILLNTNDQLVLEKVVEIDMKIVKLKDKIITGELHTKPRTSPLYNCSHCIEIVNYLYKDGDLVKLK
jgi:hypothetical protein